jgi:hypothetical protein
MLNFDVHAFVRGRTCRAALIAGEPDRPMIRRNKRLTPWDSIFQTPACASFGEALLKMRSHDSTRLHLPAWGGNCQIRLSGRSRWAVLAPE